MSYEKNSSIVIYYDRGLLGFPKKKYHADNYLFENTFEGKNRSSNLLLYYNCKNAENLSFVIEMFGEICRVN